MVKILAIFCTAVALTQAQIKRFPRKNPLESFKSKDCIVFTQYDVDDDKAYIEYAPADPNEQEVGHDNALNSTVILHTKGGFVGEYRGLVASHDATKVWMNNYRRAALIEYDVTQNVMTTVAKDLTNGLEDLAYDRVTKILYWTDSIENIIMAMDTSSYRHFVKIWISSTVSPYALTLHTTKRKLFFGVYRSQSTRTFDTELIKCDLDGSNRQTILQFPDVIRPRGITIDFSENKLYWTDINFSAESVVLSSDLKGRHKREIFSSPKGLLWDIAHYGNYLYITDVANTTVNEYNIYIREKNGSREKTITTTFRPRNIDIYAPNKVSTTKVRNECKNAKCEHICVGKSIGHVCKCSPGYTLVSGYKCVADVLDDDYLLVADIGQKRVFQLPLKTPAFLANKIIAMPWDDDTNEKIFAVAVDQKNGNKVWYDLENKRLVWGSKIINFSDGVSSIIFHCCEDKIFWSSNTQIHYWDGTSSSYETLYSLSLLSDSEIRQMTIDCLRDQLYWVEYDSDTKKAVVKRSDLKGKKVEIVLKNLPASKGITIDYKTYTLYVMTMIDGVLYSLPLKLLEKIPSTSPNYGEYQSITFGASFGSAIWDIRVKNGIVYLADSTNSQIRSYSISLGPSSMKNYGPKFFFAPVTLDFYDEQYYDKHIKPSCPHEQTTPSPSVASTTPQPNNAPTSTVPCSSIVSTMNGSNLAWILFNQCIAAELEFIRNIQRLLFL